MLPTRKYSWAWQKVLPHREQQLLSGLEGAQPDRLSLSDILQLTLQCHLGSSLDDHFLPGGTWRPSIENRHCCQALREPSWRQSHWLPVDTERPAPGIILRQELPTRKYSTTWLHRAKQPLPGLEGAQPAGQQGGIIRRPPRIIRTQLLPTRTYLSTWLNFHRAQQLLQGPAGARTAAGPPAWRGPVRSACPQVGFRV